MATLITKTETEALLGRSLSSKESTNFDLYMGLAESRLLDVLCRTAYPAEIDDELKLIIAQMFSVIVLEQNAITDSGTTSKKVEDFSITYGSNPETPEVTFERTYARIIAKYSECGFKFRSGKVGNADCIRCI